MLEQKINKKKKKEPAKEKKDSENHHLTWDVLNTRKGTQILAINKK